MDLNKYKTYIVSAVSFGIGCLVTYAIITRLNKNKIVENRLESKVAEESISATNKKSDIVNETIPTKIADKIKVEDAKPIEEEVQPKKEQLPIFDNNKHMIELGIKNDVKYYIVKSNNDISKIRKYPTVVDKDSSAIEEFIGKDKVLGFIDATDWLNIYNRMSPSFPVKIYYGNKLDELEIDASKMDFAVEDTDAFEKIKQGINTLPLRYTDKTNVNLGGMVYINNNEKIIK